MDLYFFDFDKTLYAYDFRKRLPALALITGTSQYHLAKTWWAGGFERRAESGEFGTAAEYLAEFERVTGAPLTLDEWQRARMEASTPIPASVEALRKASNLGTVSLFSNNPSPFALSLPVMAPDVCAIVQDNRLVSCNLGARKPDVLAYERALDKFGGKAADTFFIDDSAENVAAAVAIGMHGHHLNYVDGVPQVAALDAAIDKFANRKK